MVSKNVFILLGYLYLFHGLTVQFLFDFPLDLVTFIPIYRPSPYFWFHCRSHPF